MSDLPLLQITPVATGGRPAAALTRERYAQLAARAKLLSWLSLGWMTIEGAGVGFTDDACEDECCR